LNEKELHLEFFAYIIENGSLGKKEFQNFQVKGLLFGFCL